MRKSILLSFYSVIFSFCVKAQVFTSGNIAVFVAGGATANNTTGSIVEFSTTGTGIVSHTIPDGASNASGLRFSGSATSTGYLANSNDRSLLCFTGHNNSNTSSNANTLNPRGAATFNAAGTYNLATTYTGTSGNQTRCATSLNNSSWFIADQGGAYTNSSSSASPTGNFRAVKSFGGIVYIGQASSTAANIQVSTISAPSGGTVTGLPGLANNASHQDFYLISSGSNGTAYDILYIISATSNTAGSLAKYSLVSGTWIANGTFTTSFGGFGIAALKNGAGADIFVSTGQGALAANSLLKLNDATGYNTTISITNNGAIYTTAAGTVIKGVAFAPVAAVVTPSVSLSVSSNTGSENTPGTIITVTATASSPVTGDQTVLLNVSGTNITAGDYTLSNTTITILNGQTTGTVNFNVQDDAVVESLETVALTISSPSSGITIGSPSSQNIDITDNDVALPTVDLSVSAGSGSEELQTSITVTATASSPVSGNQTVTLGVSGTGITAADYVLSGTTITILNGQTTGTRTFKIRNDAETEGSETATLTISNPSSGITLGTTTTQNVSITDFTCQPLIRKSTATSTNGAEISAFDPSTNKIFTVAGPAVEYYSLSSAGLLSGPTNMPLGFSPPVNTIALPNSVAIRNGIVAVSYAVVENGSNAQQQGIVAFYNSSTSTYIHHVTVGYLPDMIIFTPDGQKLLTADEGEPNSYGQGNSFDPEGSVSIIDISGGVLSATVNIVGFTSFNGQEATLRAAGVRIYGPGANAAKDLEPEYIAFSPDGTTAFITLQENNAVAKLDIATAIITEIIPLGLKNHNLAGNGLDASDQDGGTINIQNWPIYGMYEPDAISSFTVGGNTYFITANEGDSRAWTGFSEEIRVGSGSYTLDPTIFPNAATLKLNTNLGRLQLTNATGDTDGDGDFDQIHALGARSFSIWSSTFSQVFDSGDQLEQISAAQNPANFNSEGAAASFDTRSDNKGPEPEAATTGTVNGVLYAFVGSERTGDIYVYDISNPNAPVFKQYIDHPADLGVEGLVFIPANQSPTGKALLVSSAEVSRTVTVYEFSSFSDNLVTTNTAISQTQGTNNTYGNCNGVLLTIAQSGGSPVSGNVDVKVWIETSQPSSYVKRHYEATPTTNASTATGRVTLYFTQQEFDDLNAVNTVDLPINSGDASGKANLLIEKRGGSSSDGSGLPNTYPGPVETINPNDTDIVWNATASRWEISFDITGFSGFFVKVLLPPLPVNWLTINGNLNNQKQAVINWKVQESNIATYMIEKSVNGSVFNFIGMVNSRGDGENSYQFTEPLALQGTAYYRIRQTGMDGRSNYSPVIKLANKQDGVITIYPNPVKDKLIITIPGDLQNTQARLLDINGKEIRSIILNGQSLSVDMTHLPSGLYIIHFVNGQTEKFIKQ